MASRTSAPRSPITLYRVPRATFVWKKRVIPRQAEVMAEASTWVTRVLMSGFFKRYLKLKAVVFESDSTWINFVVGQRGV